MRHYVLTRAVYADWPEDAARRRLDVFKAVTVPSMAAQTLPGWEWVLCINPTDPLLPERLAAAAQAGVPVHTVPATELREKRSEQAMWAYRADWLQVIGTGPRLTTRIDDDDAFTPTALARMNTAGSKGDRSARRALILPEGVRVWRGRFQRVRHESNAFATLYTPPRDKAHVYTYMHRGVARYCQVRLVDDRPGWLWVRHDDTLSGHQAADRPLTARVRSMFPVDWGRLLELQGGQAAQPRPGVVRFR